MTPSTRKESKMDIVDVLGVRGSWVKKNSPALVEFIGTGLVVAVPGILPDGNYVVNYHDGGLGIHGRGRVVETGMVPSDGITDAITFTRLLVENYFMGSVVSIYGHNDQLEKDQFLKDWNPTVAEGVDR
jgi:hypothetical protein